MSTTNKLTLIIPDLHHRWQQAEKIISVVGADEVVFLGDFFDDFDDTSEMVKDTCDWLISSVNKPNRIHLMGNHESPYCHPYYRVMGCSGHDDWKQAIIDDNISRSTWDRVKWYHILDNMWLLSHAGLHKRHIPESIYKLYSDRETFYKSLGEYLDNSLAEGLREAANNISTWIFSAGYYRGGNAPIGGITWCDFTGEFVPTKGLNQIFGHTPGRHGKATWSIIRNEKTNREIRFLEPHKEPPFQLNNTNQSYNLCLDVWKNTHWAIWDGQQLKIDNYSSL